MKYIQSYYQYPVTFTRVIGKNENGELAPIVVPCKNADGELRNIVAVEDDKVEELRNKEPMFRELEGNKKFRVLNHLPESYKASSQQINEARAEAEAAKAELEKVKKELAEAKGETTLEPIETATESTPEETKSLDKMSYKELEALASELGIEHKNSKAEFIKAIKDAKGE